MISIVLTRRPWLGPRSKAKARFRQPAAITPWSVGGSSYICLEDVERRVDLMTSTATTLSITPGNPTPHISQSEVVEDLGWLPRIQQYLLLVALLEKKRMICTNLTWKTKPGWPWTLIQFSAQEVCLVLVVLVISWLFSEERSSHLNWVMQVQGDSLTRPGCTTQGPRSANGPRSRLKISIHRRVGGSVQRPLGRKKWWFTEEMHRTTLVWVTYGNWNL